MKTTVNKIEHYGSQWPFIAIKGVPYELALPSLRSVAKHYGISLNDRVEHEAVVMKLNENITWN